MTLILILTIGFAASSSLFAEEDIEFIPGEDSGFYYTIKKGDTLWDLSHKFYNSQWDWPGLWELNDEIKNPHWIYPGKKIKIFFKDKGRMKPIIVPVKKVEKPMITEKIIPEFSYSQMDAIGFIKRNKQESYGHVLKEEDGHIMMDIDDVIYIKPTGSRALVPGEKYHVFNATEIGQKKDEVGFTGFKHLIKAEMEVLALKDGYVTAKITRSFRPVLKDDLIMDYYNRDEILTVDEAPPAIDARLICAEDDNLMVNDYTIAFIDIGKDKVIPGQIYTVLRTNKLVDKSKPWEENGNEHIKLENLPSGKLIVLHTEDIASTVMILSSGYAIHPDDFVN